MQEIAIYDKLTNGANLYIRELPEEGATMYPADELDREIFKAFQQLTDESKRTILANLTASLSEQAAFASDRRSEDAENP